VYAAWRLQGNAVSRKLFAAAYAQKRAALRAGDLSGGRLGAFWDALVFSKIRARLGGPPFLPPPACR
jgi:long-chain acyl-CoA synthetase